MNEKINVLENPVIGGIEQWLLIRGENISNPVLLLLQAGPGFPMICEADMLEKKLNLEKYFTVVYWDQRGCGKSFSKNIPESSMNLNQMVMDTNEVTGYLQRKLNKKKIFMAGFSLGGTIALISASQHPENYLSVIIIGADIIMEDAERYAYDFAVSEAKRRKNKNALNQLRKIGEPPHADVKSFQTRVKWVTSFGGIQANETYFSLFLKTIRNLFKSPFYSINDIINTIKGINFSQKHLLPKLTSLNLFNILKTLETKLYFIQGKNDAAAPFNLANKYFEFLSAPKGKCFYTFNSSAHMPHLEEPEKFSDFLVREIRTNQE